MKTSKTLIVIVALAAILSAAAPQQVLACSSAIISGKATPDGRPLLWKHRDTGQLNNRIEYVGRSKDVKYAFIALVNYNEPKEAWSGTNEVGFSIMNTASYNLQEQEADVEDMEGVVMYDALRSCRTLADFEKLLDKRKRPMGLEANFGVIDAEGGAAYYEVNNTEWRKVDVNDPKIAPQGYLVYTNHSYTGRLDDGSGYIRYTTASEIMINRVGTGRGITPQWIFNALSREFYHSLLGIDLRKDSSLTPNGWFPDCDFIPRRSTSASTVVKGVKKGENPLLTVMWTVLGYPPVSVAVPLFVAAGENQPAMVMAQSKDNQRCKMCDVALARRAKVFSLARGNGKTYLQFCLLQNEEGTGYMQRLAPYEQKVFETFNPAIEEWYAKGEVDLGRLQELYAGTDFALDVK